MLKTLKFVQGAVSKKDIVPALTHFAIENGQVRGFNGTIGLCAPISIDINCRPKAATLVHAINQCKEIPQLTMTKAGRLQVKSGKFKVLVECLDEVMPYIVPTGKSYEIDAKLLLSAMKMLVPVVTTNTKHAWANGIRFENGLALATNNVILVQYWTNCIFAEPLTIPLVCIEELLRLNEEPTHVQISPTSITFHFEGGRWLYSNLVSATWPDLSRILENPSNQVAMPDELYTALETMKPFTNKDGTAWFYNNKITTAEDGSEGAEYEVENFPGFGIYQVDMFLLLKDIMKTIDLTLYPKPALFFGDNLRGAIIGRVK